MRRLVAVLALICIVANGVGSPLATEKEVKDWGVIPIGQSKREDLHSPTPTTIPGGKTILASELHSLIGSSKPIVIDVLGGDLASRSGLPGAIYMGDEIGKGRIGVEMRGRFRAALEKLTGEDKSRQLVFYCLSSECWLSYNAALRAIAAGYTNVLWFRGGIEAWKELKYPGEKAKPFDW